MGHADALITELFRHGAKVDQRSLHPDGFTPLMFATADRVPPTIFLTFLKKRSNQEQHARLSPGGTSMSFMQCLFLGFPLPNPETHASDMAVHDEHNLKDLVSPPEMYAPNQCSYYIPERLKIRELK